MILELLIVLASFQSAVQPPAAISYEAFCQLDEAEKKKRFRAAPSETQAMLARTQIERWREANQPGLTSEQLDVLKELLAVATAETFALNSTERRARLSPVEARAGASFRGKELDEMGPTGPCLAKKSPK